MSNVFDQRVNQQAAQQAEYEIPENIAARADSTPNHASFASEMLVGGFHLADSENLTPPAIKSAVQELLRTGVVEAEERPKVYDLLRQRPREIAQALEPLDLQCRLDEVRGLAYLSVGRNYAGSESAAPADGTAEAPAEALDTGWTHPLVRRQRLNLEQSLLLALLRQLPRARAASRHRRRRRAGRSGRAGSRTGHAPRRKRQRPQGRQAPAPVAGRAERARCRRRRARQRPGPHPCLDRPRRQP